MGEGFAWGACSIASLLGALLDANSSRWPKCGYGVVARGLVCGRLRAPGCVCGGVFLNFLMSM